MTDVMIDLETLGVHPDAYILEIGAVLFDKDTVHMDRVFQRHLRGPQPGRRIDPDTVAYWMAQEGEGKQRIVDGMRNGVPLFNALIDLEAWFKAPGNEFEHVWCRGASFDLAILRHAYATDATPWPFRCELDTRTLSYLRPHTEDYKDLDESIAEKIMGRKPIRHSAIDDCVIEACRIMGSLR